VFAKWIVAPEHELSLIDRRRNAGLLVEQQPYQSSYRPRSINRGFSIVLRMPLLHV
jgi:hypothetical protein